MWCWLLNEGIVLGGVVNVVLLIVFMGVCDDVSVMLCVVEWCGSDFVLGDGGVEWVGGMSGMVNVVVGL